MLLKKELLKRFELDQKLSKEKRWDRLKSVYSENTFWLKKIIKKVGWPSQKIVGIGGEQSAWLIVQHSYDLKFQKECLSLIKNLPQTIERKGHIAYLTDIILVSENKKQIYGTQFNPTTNEPYDILNSKDLDYKRKKMGLEPFNQYKQKMKLKCY